MTLATIVLLLAAAVIGAHTGTFAFEARWHAKRARVVTNGHGATRLKRLYDGLAREAHMRANPPWYVRYNRWLTREGKR